MPKRIIVDRNIVSEILINLIVNAIKLSEGGEVSTFIKVNKDIGVSNNEVALRFMVKDNGSGISEDKKKYYF